MKKLTKIATLVLSVCFAGQIAFAAGFGLYEFSARGNAMGGAVLAGEAEPASLALNPALITQLPGKQVQLSATLVTAKIEDVEYGNHKTSTDRQWWPLPALYYTQQVGEKWWLGLGAFTRFGLSNDYPDKGWLLSGSGGASLYHVGVVTYTIQPTVAYQATDKLSVAAGLEVQYLNFTEKVRFGVPTTYSDMNLDGDSYAWSGMIAFFYNANEKVNFGGSFRMRNDHNVRGPLKYDTNMLGFTEGGDFWGDITFPAQLALGASYKPTDKWLFEFNWTNIFWSCFRSIDIYFDNVPVDSGYAPMLGTPQGNMKQYQDAYRIGIGAEYTLNDITKLRGSFIFDKSPLNQQFLDVMLPADDRYIVGVGAGFDLGKNVLLDLSYNILFVQGVSGVAADHTTPVHFKDSQSHLFGLSVRYTF
ncbi:MAG: outer membrane protein transport protein [Elusimicrobiaceae bacterium]|nr:outer membrane protein transport protein [Elusimicrobiaceae bacterium]